MTRIDWWAALGLALGWVQLGCNRAEPDATAPAARCSAEVTDGNGRFWAVTNASSGAPEKPLRKQAIEQACGQMCRQREAPNPRGCVARCLVDIDATKVGARVSCSHTSPAAAPSASAAP